MVDQFGYYIFEEVMKMMLEMVLSEKKAKENNIDINECYEKVDRFFKKEESKNYLKACIQVVKRILIFL